MDSLSYQDACPPSQETPKAATYSHFADGVMDSFAAAHFFQCDGVELAFVQVSHRAVPRLLSQRLGGLQGVLKVVPAKPRGQRLLRHFPGKLIKCFTFNLEKFQSR